MTTDNTRWENIARMGKWLRAQRVQRGMGVRDIGLMSDMHASSVSRFERGLVDPKLLSLLRISRGFHIPFEQFLEDVADLKIPRVPTPSKAFHEGGEQITLDDLRILMQRLRHSVDKVASQLLTLSFIASKELDQAQLDPTLNREARLADEDALWSLAMHWKVPYLLSISGEYIEYIYKSGGVLTLRDVGQFINRNRTKHNLILAYLEERTGISDTGIIRLEQGSVENALLSDILALAKHMPDAENLLGMYVNALQPYLETARPNLRRPEKEIEAGKWSQNELEVAIKFVWLWRWIEWLPDKWKREQLAELFDLA